MFKVSATFHSILNHSMSLRAVVQTFAALLFYLLPAVSKLVQENLLGSDVHSIPGIPTQ